MAPRKKMRILHLVHRFPPSVGGSQLYAADLARAQAALGHEVTVATTQSVDPFLDVRGWTTRGLVWKSSYPDLPREEDWHGVHLVRFPPDWIVLTYLHSSALARWVRLPGPEWDVVHAHGYTFAEPWHAARLARRGGRPVLALSGHDFTQPHPGLLWESLLRLYHAARGRPMLRRFQVLFANTGANREDYRRLGVPADRIAVIPPGIDPDPYHADPASKPDELQLLFVARLVRYKGAQHAVSALPGILGRQAAAHLTLVGADQGYRASLEALVRRLGLGGHVTFAGQVSDAELVRLFRRSHFFVFPSIHEGFGLVTLQAIAAGCYPILADSPALRCLAAEFGCGQVAMADPRGAADQIARQIAGLGAAERVSRVRAMQARLEERYRWPAIALRMVQAYQAAGAP